MTYSPWYCSLFGKLNLATDRESNFYKNVKMLKYKSENEFRMLAVANDVSECFRVDALGKFKNIVANSGYYVFGVYAIGSIWMDHYLKWIEEKDKCQNNQQIMNRELFDSIFFQSIGSFAIPLSVVVGTRTIYNVVLKKYINISQDISKHPEITNKFAKLIRNNIKIAKPIIGLAPIGIALGIVFNVIHPADEMVKNFQKTSKYIEFRDSFI